MGEAISGGQFPLKLKMGDLVAAPESWRQFTLPAGEVELFLGLTTDFDGTAPGPYLLYFTQGKTFRSEGQSYLVVYRTSLPSRETGRLAQDSSGRDQNKGENARLSSTTSLSLGLLNIATSGNLLNIAPFDPSLIAPSLTPTQQQATQTESQSEASLSNLKQIGLGLTMYTQDYDEKLPTMNSATKAQIETTEAKVNINSRVYNPGTNDSQTPRNVQERLYPYLKSIQLFRQPGAGKLYQTNGSLSGRTLASINDTSTMVSFYETAPDAAGKRGVLFVDGHVKRINETDWPQLRRASLITIRLTGAAALYYAYKKQPSPAVKEVTGKFYLSSNGRVYLRHSDGSFQWISPPDRTVEVPYETGQYLGLSKYQGYNGSTSGKTFGGYGVKNDGRYADTIPAPL